MDESVLAVPGMEGFFFRRRGAPSFYNVKEVTNPALQFFINETFNSTKASALIQFFINETFNSTKASALILNTVDDLDAPFLSQIGVVGTESKFFRGKINDWIRWNLDIPYKKEFMSVVKFHQTLTTKDHRILQNKMASKNNTLSLLILSLSLLHLNLQFSRAQDVVRAAYWFPDSGIDSSDIDASLFTHLFCAFADLNSQTNQVTVSPANSAPFSAFTRTLQQKNPSIKTLMSIGGGNSPRQYFSAMAKRFRLAKSLH
ncbi:hypothetical protein Syun_026040 [Stephania yunnanensis]|uniref:GH18 domain-containing protein n=1 Tax=Stephania yunnanensis TaxID=152371 RepID=A0AAP0EST4_9MAGN